MSKFYNATISGDGDSFEIVANSAALMDFGGEAVVIDIGDKLRLSSHTDKPPLLVDHDYSRPIGHIETLNVEDNVIKARGIFSIDNEDSRKIKESLASGFPWQASLGFTVNAGFRYGKGEELKTQAGDSFKCSKRTTRATDITVWECSVVLFGADNRTSMKLAQDAQLKDDSNNIMDNLQEPIKEPVKVDAKAPTIDSEKLEREAIERVRAREKQELERIEAIKAIADKYDAADKIGAAIDAGDTPEKFELNVLRASYGSAPKTPAPTEQENETQVLEAAAILSAGYQPKGYSEKIVEAANAQRGKDFRDIFEAATGFRPTYEQQKNADLWTAAASTYNLGSILTNCANAILLQAFEEQDTEFREVFKVSTVSNFKTAERYRLASDFEFKKIENGEEFSHGTLDDTKWTIKADVYGRQGELTYQDIVNGDALDVFGDIMRRFAWGANRAINKKVWSLFLNPVADASGNDYFSAAHGNLVASSALTAANLATNAATFITRKRGFGVDADEILGIRPELLIVPPSLKYTADLITKATTFSPVASTISNYNPHSGYNWRVISVADLEDSTYGGGYSASTWYLAANPAKIAGFEIAFLNGQQAPTIRQGDIAIGRLGIQFDGHVDFGVSQQDYRAVMKCTA